MKTNDKPLTEICGICKNKIHLDMGLGWADMGPKERPEFSVHVECLGLEHNVLPCVTT